MRIGIPREIGSGERRVSGTPRTVKRLVQGGFDVVVERGAGEMAEHSDAGYSEAGATLVDASEAWASDIVLKVLPPMERGDGTHEVDALREGAVLIGFVWPAQNEDLLARLNAKRATVIAMDCVPRTSRAQKVDALSAMANAAGFRAVIEAVNAYPRFLAGQSTAAGAIKPAKVLIIGAGVAGLAAIGAARGLGAIVRAFDTRLEVGDQVRSMGADFLELEFAEDGSGEGGYAKTMCQEFIDAEMKMFAQQAMEVDIIITTALIPGKPAPKLITPGMVESMRDGSVIVDLAAQQGGNCALTKPGEVVHHRRGTCGGVTIIGFTDLPSRMAIQTSWLYASTLVNMVEEMGGAGSFRVDLENDIVRPSLVCHEGETTWPPPQPSKPAGTPPGPAKAEEQVWSEETRGDAKQKADSEQSRGLLGLASMIVAALAMVGVAAIAPDDEFVGHLTVFVLACFVGWQVVWNVTPALHTPLMSVTNAISGIILIGGMLHVGGSPGEAITLLGAAAVFVAAINVCGGFLVTRRMLGMFVK